jgi:hypothetical protein
MVHHWSIRSLVIGAAFLTALAAATIVDADAILQYIQTGNGSSDMMLMYGSIITIAAAAVFLAMGLSIAEDDLHSNS